MIRPMLALFLITLSLVACSNKNLQPIGPEATILAFGDSLTAGVGVDREQSYPAVLERLSQRSVVNAGISGEISATGLSRLPEVLDAVRPALMVLLHGGNDILRNLDISQTRKNLSAMIEIAQQRNVQVVLVGVPEKNLFSDSAAIYSELAEQYGLVFHDEIIADLIRSPSKKSDSVHFNALGYSELAEAINTGLLDAGAI